MTAVLVFIVVALAASAVIVGATFAFIRIVYWIASAVAALRWFLRRTVVVQKTRLGVAIEPVASAWDGRPWFRVTFTRDGQLIAEIREQAPSMNAMTERALSRDVVLFRCGATVSVFDAHGNLLTVNGDASVWMSERVALLAAHEELVSRAPRAFVLAARLLPPRHREDFLSEVLDEVEMAREQGRSLGHRYLSLALFAIPSEIWHAGATRRQDIASRNGAR